MRIVLIGDTHALHRELEVPPGDLLIHAGDFTHPSLRLSMLQDFNAWLGELPHKCKVVVPGNHDHFLEQAQHQKAITNATLPIDTGIEIEGIRIWGSPITPLSVGAFGNPFLLDRKHHWAQVPDGTDILVTHCPPYGILDGAAGTDEHEGCSALREAVARVKPRLHVFGHVHTGYGIVHTKRTMFANTSLYHDGELAGKPIVLNFAPR
jgi:Icc-related predicted phosphoesterase